MTQQPSSLVIRRLSDSSPTLLDQSGMKVAEAAAMLAKCTRRQCGAAIFGPDTRIISTGRNGAPAGWPHCTDGACPRGRHYPRHNPERAKLCFPQLCACGLPHPCPEYVQPYEPYDKGPGLCTAIHAEANAIIYAGYSRLPGARIYITDAPCHTCTLLIAATGIAEAVIP